MAHLIDKSKLLEGLKKLKQNLSASPIVVMEDVESLVDTLEVKEVNLDEEIEECLKQYHMIAVGKEEFEPIAKYFFELGLKAQKGE